MIEDEDKAVWKAIGKAAFDFKNARAALTAEVEKNLLPGMTIYWLMKGHAQKGQVIRVNSWSDRIQVENERTGLVYWISLWSIHELEFSVLDAREEARRADGK